MYDNVVPWEGGYMVWNHFTHRSVANLQETRPFPLEMSLPLVPMWDDLCQMFEADTACREEHGLITRAHQKQWITFTSAVDSLKHHVRVVISKSASTSSRL